MPFFPRLLLPFVAATFLTDIPTQARLVPGWSYQDLTAKSDLIVIAEPLKNESNAEKLEWPMYSHGVSTTFNVLCCLKGNLNSGTLVIKHFVFTNIMPPNAGALINFLIGPVSLKATVERDGKAEAWDLGKVTPCWLAFLLRNADGTFMPTSGQIDPNFSFRELHGVFMYGTVLDPR